MFVYLAENSLRVYLLFLAARGWAQGISSVWSRAAERQKAEVVGVGCYKQATPSGVRRLQRSLNHRS
jgi:hypothetical protein